MELPCLAAETPTTASSCSTDPPYDNYCRPHAERGRDRNRERERERGRGGIRPTVTGALLASYLPGPVPAVAVVPTLGGGRGQRGADTGPEQSQCSWGGLGRQGWDTGPGTQMGGGGGGERGREETQEEEEEEESPSPAHSQEEHQSALSVYDNLDATTPAEEDVAMAATTAACFPEPQCRPMIRVAISGLTLDGTASGDSSSWSSCEIVLAESRASNGPDQDQDQDQDRESQPDSGSSPFHQDEPRPYPQPLTQPQAHFLACLPHLDPPVPQPLVPPHPLQGSVPHLGGLLQQAGPGLRVPPPLPLADPSASALRSLLTNLQQQIVRQREEYEARIHSLEQRNKALEAEVLGLRCNLVQQRRWYSVVQAKIVEAETARAAADVQNAALQREMEQFLDTFGELNNEAKKTERIVRSF